LHLSGTLTSILIYVQHSGRLNQSQNLAFGSHNDYGCIDILCYMAIPQRFNNHFMSHCNRTTCSPTIYRNIPWLAEIFG